MKWRLDDIPDQSGRLAIVTGANSGLGFETARGLASRGAKVLLACRSAVRGGEAIERIRQESHAALLEFRALDLSSLASVRAFARDFVAEGRALDLLVLNAGVMAPPYGRTEDGFELQFGINYLGHFALTGLLLDRLKATPGSRVVHVSSAAHKLGVIDFDNLDWSRKYRKWTAYGASKLANLLFAYEMQRRLDAAGVPVVSAAAHPGWAATSLQDNSGLFSFLNPVFGQSPAAGALPTLYAATAADVKGGEYFGPDGLWEWRGGPRRVESNARSHDADLAARLWARAEELTGVSFLPAGRGGP